MSQNSPTLLPSRETGASPSCLIKFDAAKVRQSPETAVTQLAGDFTKFFYVAIQIIGKYLLFINYSVSIT